MADPISLMAVAGLIYAGRTLSTKSVSPSPPPVEEVQQTVAKGPIVEVQNNEFSPMNGVPQKREMESFADTLQN